MLSVVIVPASADFGGGVGRSDFFTWTDGFGGGSYGGGVGRDQSKTAYDDYVETLPATGYTSAGGLSWKIVPYLSYVMGEDRASGERLTDYVRAFGQSKGGYSTFVSFVLLEDFVAPIDGTYSLSAVTLDSYLATGSAVSSSAHNFNKLLLAGETVARAGTVGSSVNQILSVGFDSKTERGYWYGYVVISCVPHAPLGADTYNINTRPTSITGGNYGIIGDNGQITKVEDNSTIINETNNTYYNPATGQTVPISNWSYDYSDRSYKVTLESGDTATITYGDENITIQEGDTVYNVYYLVDGAGNPPCEHDWQEGEATVPTCVRPGSASYVCSKCQQTKKEALPALGHDWQVKQTVTTQYDDTGQLTQEGYTIFECLHGFGSR